MPATGWNAGLTPAWAGGDGAAYPRPEQADKRQAANAAAASSDAVAGLEVKMQ